MAEENIEVTNNLENLLSPFCYEPEVSLPKTIPEVPGGMYLSGFISQDCSWGCCFNNSVIKCFPVDRYFDDNHTSFAAHSSNASVAVSTSSYNFPGGHITCATELAIHNPRTSSGTRKLLLGISYIGDNNNGSIRGAVVLFDPIRCAPMKWIEIPDPVSSITVLSHFEEGGSNRPFFNETMMAMVGIAAVGLRGGSVIIIDLGLDDPNLSIVSSADGRNVSNFTYRLLYVNPHEYVIATKRHNAVSKRSLIALKFTNEPDTETVTEAFYYCKPNGETILSVHKNSVAVTCLEYVPAIGSLLVGFTCGGFQIWRVNNMELQFSSEPIRTEQGGSCVHVYDFSFQQPVDDPKNYCYIWVMYGNKSAECTSTHIELHTLYYERKNYAENFGFVYDGLRQCTKRMTFPLLDDFLPNDSENEDSSIRCSARPIRIWTQPDSDLMYCAWEVGRGGIFYLGAFDLNQWYSNHTKEHIFYNPDSGLCPYWVALPVDIPDFSNFVMDLRIMPKTLMRWENPHAKLDVHLYPASVSFRAVCLTNTGVFAFEHFGIQEKLIRIMLKDGPSLMIQPKSIKNSFIRYGLEPVLSHVYGDWLSQKDRDRYFIFSALLENRRTPAIIRLASVWLDGSYANVGCTIDLIIDWISCYMQALRGGADEHWQNLGNFADYTLPPETVKFINFSNFSWSSLHRLLLTLMGPSEIYTVRRQELESMEFGLGKFVQYSAALLMMYKAKLLPEVDGSFIKSLTEYYESRRQEARNALDNSLYIDAQHKKSHPLMIDHLMDDLFSGEECLREEWHVEEGQHCYPPQHVGYIVNMFMWPDADPKAVSRVFMYFLFDLSSFNQNASTSHNSCAIERKVRGDFKAVMDSAAEEYQEILGLWLLDHGYPEEILVHLKENDRLHQRDGLPWCAATVALTATGYENDVAELLLRSCPHSLAKLLFSLMTSSISKYTSLAELMLSSNLNTDKELLQQFFQISETRERLAEFIRTKSKELPEGVKGALLAFLNDSSSVKRLSQLLMYYVHTENFKMLGKEFTRVREILQHRNLSDIDRKMWKFQETYITHLLKTTKGSAVQQFLRLQSPQSVRPMQTTISIKAVPVVADSPDEIPRHIPNEPKLPPHLRRIKLNETIMQDPLSPLRRYAGRMQSAVASDSDGEKEDDRISRRLSSRKSISRRISLSITRKSIANTGNTSCNENLTNEEKLNNTAKNSHIDLIRLLKTPSFDHRIDNRQKTSFITLDQTTTQGQCDESLSLPPPQPHSIMKETDPSKPKVSKKMELRFENLSLSSDEGNEKNLSIYEDADDNIEDDNNLPNTVFDASFNSASDKSLFFGDESAAEDKSLSIIEEEEIETQTSPAGSQSSKVGSVRATRSTTPTRELFPEGAQVNTEVEEKGESPTSEMEVVSDESPSTALPSDTRVVVDETVLEDIEDKRVQIDMQDKSFFSKPQEVVEETIMEDIEDKNTQFEMQHNPFSSKPREVVDETMAEEIEDRPKSRTSSSQSSSTENVRTTRSTTPTRKLAPEVHQVTAEGKPQGQSGRRARSKTPTRELVTSDEAASKSLSSKHQDVVDETIVEDIEDKNTQSSDRPKSRASSVCSTTRKSVRATRSTTPTRDIVAEAHHVSAEESAEGGKLKHRVGRSTRSKTPTRDLEAVDAALMENIEDIVRTQVDKPKSRASSISSSTRRNTRSTTPTRELVNAADSPEARPQRRSGRSTRSTTPTRDMAAISDESLRKSVRRGTRRPRDDLDETLTDDIEDKFEIPSSRASSISSTSRISLRATRSTTPTRDLVAEVQVKAEESEEGKPQLRRGRSTRSKTPTRDIEVKSDDSPRKSLRRGTRSSKPSEILDETLVEDTEDMNTTQIEMPNSQASSQSSITRRSLRATRSTTPTREPVPEVQVKIEESEEGKPQRRGGRSTRSKTPTREMQIISEESPPPKSLRGGNRSSKTPTRDVSAADERVKDEQTSHTKPLKRGGKKAKHLEIPEPSTSTSFNFEITQEDMEEEEEEEEVVMPSTSRKRNTGKPPKTRKRGLKYFQHRQDLSTVIEDSGTDLSESVSIFEATVIPTKVEPPTKGRRIKGIKMRPSEEPVPPEPEETEPAKPSKRRKATAQYFDDDLDLETSSEVSSRSTRSVSSKRSTGSTKAKTTRRKGRAASKPTN